MFYSEESLQLLQSFSVLLGRLPLQNDLEKYRDTPLRPLLLRMTEDSQLPEGLKHQFAEVLRLWDSTPKGNNISQSVRLRNSFRSNAHCFYRSATD